MVVINVKKLIYTLGYGHVTKVNICTRTLTLTTAISVNYHLSKMSGAKTIAFHTVWKIPFTVSPLSQMANDPLKG